ncbi:MAG TPA: lytic murein transglycosylase, partial [Vicinamibacterales bacterium]|nr:lytic murein transglycosylase [Vicinamibacterales bacterium]
PPFEEWLAGVRAEALERGISRQTIDAALTGLEPETTVVERDRTQVEFTYTLDAYLRRRLTPVLVRDTRRAYRRERRLLNRVSDAYGVPPAIIASIWALESNLGRFSGVRPTIQALATLAWDGRREAFFRRELLDALTIVDNGDIDLASLRGSWAGAMGQPQFMPSSYLRFAQDFDGDGRKDIWRSKPDVFASIAAYLKENGWSGRYRWGREVRLPDDLTEIGREAPLRLEGCSAKRGMTIPLPLSKWKALGVRQLDGRTLPSAKVDASLVRSGTRSFLVYPNYEALLAYNCAHAYAISVGVLSDRLGD